MTADVGKCSVCGIAKVVWIDREAGVKLCEHCYGRGLRESVQEADSAMQPIATVTGLYRGKFDRLELLTVRSPLTRDEVSTA